MPPPAFPAATVLLLRESASGLQVLLTKRAAGLSFMGGLWVFPGGRMEGSDQAAQMAARVCATSLEATQARMLGMQGTPVDRETALGLHVAACRETFEEAGLLLARPRPGGDCSDAQISRLAARRTEPVDSAGFLQLLVEEDLLLEVDRLVYWSHWITPSLEKKRFDTRFFAVPVPKGQQASVDLSELTHHAWLGQDEVRIKLQGGEMKVAPPTLATLEDLWTSHARHGGLEAMLEAERSRVVPPILPKMVRSGEDLVQILLPWDPEYASAPGEGCTPPQRLPDYLGALPSRRAFRSH